MPADPLHCEKEEETPRDQRWHMSPSTQDACGFLHGEEEENSVSVVQDVPSTLRLRRR
jgi:hypothetical protein